MAKKLSGKPVKKFTKSTAKAPKAGGGFKSFIGGK
jgi:hypothetical protein